jgi:hypothetical protein
MGDGYDFFESVQDIHFAWRISGFEFEKNKGKASLSLNVQALKYRSVTDIVRPIREIVRRREKTTGHSVWPKWNWGLLFVRPEC